MKRVAVLCLMATAALAVPLRSPGTYRSEDNNGNYAFGYANEQGAFHEETGSANMKLGSYGVTDADGTQRVVNYIADEKGFRASVEVKDQEPLQAAASTILVAQAAPVQTSKTASTESDKDPRRVDDAADKTQIVDIDQVSPAVVRPAVPVPTDKVDGVVVQRPTTPQQLPANVVSPGPQNFPGTVFFVPFPQQVAFSRVQSYSVHGFVPTTFVPFEQAKQQSDVLKAQNGIRAQIPQIPSQSLVSYQYLPRPIQPYMPIFAL